MQADIIGALGELTSAILCIQQGRPQSAIFYINRAIAKLGYELHAEMKTKDLSMIEVQDE